MLVTGVLAQKGGCGKTCIATNLAVAFSQAGRNVGVLDADPQGSFEKFASRRSNPLPVVWTATHSNLERKLHQMANEGADIVFVDTEGSLNQGTLTVPKFADYIIIPCQPSIADLESIADSVEAVSSRGKPYSVVLNRVPWLTREGDEAAEFMASASVPVAPCRLGERSAFRKAMISGQSVLEYEPHGKAAEEVQALYEFICGELKVPTGKEIEEAA